MASNGHSAVDEELYEVESILDMRLSARNVQEYLVRWVGFGPDDDTWEPEDNLLTCHDLIEKFRSTHPAPETPKSSKRKRPIEKTESKTMADDVDDEESSSASVESNAAPSTPLITVERTEQSINSSAIDTPSTPLSSTPESTDSSPNKPRKRQRAQRKYWEMVPEMVANTLRDPFWKNLEEGRVDLGDTGIYERVKRTRRGHNDNLPSTPPNPYRKRRKPIISEGEENSMDTSADGNGPLGTRPDQNAESQTENLDGHQRERQNSYERCRGADIGEKCKEDIAVKDAVIMLERIQAVEITPEEVEVEEQSEGSQQPKNLEESQPVEKAEEIQGPTAPKPSDTQPVEEEAENVQAMENANIVEQAGVVTGSDEAKADSVPETIAPASDMASASDAQEPVSATLPSKIDSSKTLMTSTAEGHGQPEKKGDDIESQQGPAIAKVDRVPTPSDDAPIVKKSLAIIEEITIDDEEEKPALAAITDKVLEVFQEVAQEAKGLVEPKDTEMDKKATQVSPNTKASLLSCGGQWRRPVKRDAIPRTNSRLVIEEDVTNSNATSTVPKSCSGATPVREKFMPKSAAVDQQPSSSSSKGQVNGYHVPSTTPILPPAAAESAIPSPAPIATSSPSWMPNVTQPEPEPVSEIVIRGLPLPLSTNLSVGTFFKAQLRQPPPPAWMLRRIARFPEFEQACCKGQVESVRQALLANKRTNPAIVDVNGRNAASGNPLLMQVCLQPCDQSHLLDDIIDLLASNGANLNARNENGDTALTMAISRNQVCKVTKLLALGAAINLPNHLGETPLMFACKKNFPGIVFRLLEYGADFNAQSADGKTAFDIAKEVADNGGGLACENGLRERSEKIMRTFDKSLRTVVSPEKFRVLYPLFPLHCYALNESSGFRIVFYSEDAPVTPTPDKVYALAIAKMRFGGGSQTDVRCWGTIPVRMVVLNEVEQAPLTRGGRFLYTMWPLKKGLNDLVIRCNDDCKQSQHKLLIHAYALGIIRI